jgi:hypothetical protein
MIKAVNLSGQLELQSQPLALDGHFRVGAVNALPATGARVWLLVSAALLVAPAFVTLIAGLLRAPVNGSAADPAYCIPSRTRQIVCVA